MFLNVAIARGFLVPIIFFINFTESATEGLDLAAKVSLEERIRTHSWDLHLHRVGFHFVPFGLLQQPRANVEASNDLVLLIPSIICGV